MRHRQTAKLDNACRTLGESSLVSHTNMSFLRFLSFHARKSRLRAEESESDDEKDTLIAPYHERASSHKRSNRRKWELALMTLGTFSLLLHIVFFARQRYHTSDASSCFEPGWTSKVGMHDTLSPPRLFCSCSEADTPSFRPPIPNAKC